MKLRPRTFQIFWDAHAWSGMLAALLLYVMFFMGAFALFYPEINVWAQPSEAVPAAVSSEAVSSEAVSSEAGASRVGSEVLARPRLQPLLEQLERERGVVGARRVAFMPERTGLRAYVQTSDSYTDFRYVPASGRLEPVRSDLGGFLYSMHYLGPIPYGVYVAGLAAMALFLALVSGVFIHVKDLIRQWFTFRPERVLRTWTSDMHKVLGVFGLPYQLLYAWTGAVLCLGYVAVEPVFLELVFGGREQARALARGESPEAVLAPTGKRTAALPDLDAWVAVAERRVPGIKPNWIGLENVGDEASTLSLYGDVEGSAFDTVDVVLRARDGAVLGAHGPGEGNAYQRFEAWFYGLHYARFGGYAVKLLYALLALASCAVIATGNLVWLERRDPKRALRGHRILERLTVGVCAGVVVATAAAFLGNRLLLGDVPNRARLEQWVFWGAWLPALALPFVWREPRRVSALELLAAGALVALTVVLDVVTRPSTLDSPIHSVVLTGLTLFGGASLLTGAGLWRPRSRSRSGASRSGVSGESPA